MPKQYIPKNDPLPLTRLKKIAHELIKDSKEDRELALEVHRFFRRMVDENPADSTAKSLMVDALKTAQASKNNVIKVMGLVIKMEETKDTDKTKASGGAQSSIFSELDRATEDD